jgi:hypothetical protein
LLIVHRFVTLFALQLGVAHAFAPLSLEQFASQLVLPVPDVVLPAEHAVHALLPVALVYEPVTHAVADVADAGQYEPAGQIVHAVADVLA